MSGRTRAGALVVLVFVGTIGTAVVGQDLRSGDAGGQQSVTQRPVEVRTAVSQTAVWVGDRVTYSVELRCATGVDILLDDLLKERLRIDGGEILSMEPERTESGGRVTHRIAYTLVTFRVDAASIHIPAVPVRYYSRGRGERPGDAAPAGEIIVPPLTLAVRSTVPESEEAIELRRPALGRLAPDYLRFAGPFGLGLLLLAIVPSALSFLGVARWARGVHAAYRAGRSRKQQRGSFDRISSLRPESDAERVDAFGELDQFLREHLALTTGIPAHSLTPSDTKRALQDWAPQFPHDAIESVLAACERARYASEPPSAAEWTDVLRDAGEVLRAFRR